MNMDINNPMPYESNDIACALEIAKELRDRCNTIITDELFVTLFYANFPPSMRTAENFHCMLGAIRSFARSDFHYSDVSCYIPTDMGMEQQFYVATLKKEVDNAFKVFEDERRFEEGMKFFAEYSKDIVGLCEKYRAVFKNLQRIATEKANEEIAKWGRETHGRLDGKKF